MLESTKNLGRQGRSFMAYVYILKSIYHLKTYVGHTVSLEKRIKEHNESKSTYTKRYKPWIFNLGSR